MLPVNCASHEARGIEFPVVDVVAFDNDLLSPRSHRRHFIPRPKLGWVCRFRSGPVFFPNYAGIIDQRWPGGLTDLEFVDGIGAKDLLGVLAREVCQFNIDNAVKFLAIQQTGATLNAAATGEQTCRE